MDGWTVVAAHFKAHFLQGGYAVCGGAEETAGAVPAPDSFPKCHRCEVIERTGLHLRRGVRDIRLEDKLNKAPGSQVKLPLP